MTAAFALLAASCGGSEAPSTATLDRPDTFAAAIRDVLDEWEPQADGGAIVLVRRLDGETVSAAVGVDPATGGVLSTDDRVRVGSISKVFTATLVLMLVDDGELALSDPVSAHLPDLALPTDPTIAELLGHRTGIGNYTETQAFGTVVLANPSATPTPEQLVAYVDDAADFDAGTQFAYSNTNYIVAGLLIEQVTGVDLSSVLEARITGPLALDDTEWANGARRDVVGGYSAATPSGTSTGQSYASVAYGSWAAGGLVTSVDDVATFLDALLLGDLLTPGSLEAMRGDLDDGAEYGLGLQPGADFGLGHGGLIIGFASLAQLDPDTGELLIVVVNNDQRRATVLSGRLAEVLGRS